MEPAPDGLEVKRVSVWLAEHVEGAVPPFTFSLLAGGHSNLTYRVVGDDGADFVLRRPPLGSVLATAHDMGREHRIISALGTTPVPVAPALGYCEDPSVTGAPFYVMGFVDGLILRDRASVEASLPREARAAAGEELVDTLAAIHAVDPAAVALGDLGRHEGYIARQLKRWYGQWNQSKTRSLPEIDEVHEVLAARIPEQGPACIVHGDYRLDNTMISPDGRVLAVLDWEICTLGDPLADVGLLHVYWTGPGDAQENGVLTATTAPGFPDRAEQLDRYARSSGRDLSDLDYYVAFAYWKLACIVEGVYARYLNGAMGVGRDPAEYTPFKVQVERSAALAALHVGGRR